MFLGLAWYWWLVVVIVFVVTLPFKLKLLKKATKKEERGEDEQGDRS